MVTVSKPHCTLITGASGFIGGALAKSLSKENIVCVSRKPLGFDAPVVLGEFHAPETLAKLDAYGITRVVHLAAATGGCSAEDGISINVLGTQRMLKHLIDRGCQRFVLASSIAAVGCLVKEFEPRQVPIPDDHPCLAGDAYGLSKFLMEEMAHYYARITPTAEITCLRLSGVANEAWKPSSVTAATKISLPYLELATVRVGDVLGAITAALAAPLRPGFHLYNLVGPHAACDDPTAEMLRAYYGSRSDCPDLSAYARPGRQFDSVFNMDKIKAELGFAPRLAVRLKGT